MDCAHGQRPMLAPRTDTSRRIAVLMPDLGGGGVQKMTLSLATALSERGHEVDIVVYQLAGELEAMVPPAAQGAASRPLLAPRWTAPGFRSRPARLAAAAASGAAPPQAGADAGLPESTRRLLARAPPGRAARRRPAPESGGGLGAAAGGRADQGAHQRADRSLADPPELADVAQPLPAAAHAPGLPAGRRDRIGIGGAGRRPRPGHGYPARPHHRHLQPCGRP